jgi:hypothetical protein
MKTKCVTRKFQVFRSYKERRILRIISAVEEIIKNVTKFVEVRIWESKFEYQSCQLSMAWLQSHILRWWQHKSVREIPNRGKGMHFNHCVNRVLLALRPGI